MDQTSNRIALVTGAGRGIGQAVAELLAQHFAAVVLTARTASEIGAVASRIEDAGGNAEAMAGDITDEAFVERLFALVRDRFGRLDVLVNNAGTGRFGAIEEMPVADVRLTLELNVVAAFMCMQQAVRLMTSVGNAGKIINIGSVRSHWTEAGDAGAYNASKFALRAMTESVARQLHGSGRNIAVGMVCPGIVDTTLTNPGGEQHLDWLTPETIAEAVLHAATAPPLVNVFDTVVIPVSQKPW